MATLYLSYKKEDFALAQGLGSELEELGHRSVYDAVALRPGMDWRGALIEELSRADAVVVLLTEAALASPFVMGEIGAARALFHAFGHILLLPVVIGSLPIPLVVSDVHVVQMPDRFSIHGTATEIVKAVEEHIERKHRGLPRLFISHRHIDIPVVQPLVRLIEAAFEVSPRDLRCTSVHPYTLPAGERTGDRLKTEIRNAEALLGILTPDVKASSYVLFELGASWGRRGGVTFPLLAGGATIADVPAPIGDLHTLNLSDETECHQLIDDLADVTSLRRQEKRSSLVAERIRELVQASRL